MNKTHYLIPLAAIPFTLTGCCHNNKEARPNVIFILSDDHTWQSIGAYGSLYESVDPTPNIDRLAEEGALFRNAFCTNSISGPSRASIITGKYSHANGFFKNVGAAPFDSTQITFPMMLHDHGYTTALFGKWHLESTPQGFDHYKIHVGQGQYWDPVWIEDGKRYKDKGYATTLTADSALEWLESRDKEKPFYLSVHYTAPHSPWVGCHPQEYVNLYKDCRFDSCPQREPHPWANVGVLPGYTDPIPNLQGYFAAVTAMDANIGRSSLPATTASTAAITAFGARATVPSP